MNVVREDFKDEFLSHLQYEKRDVFLSGRVDQEHDHRQG